jgi:peptidoglycan/xylan/chitin deacetylase (PgdA/CDA1 family)
MLSIFQLSVAQIEFCIIFCLILITLIIMAVAPVFSNNLVNQLPFGQIASAQDAEDSDDTTSYELEEDSDANPPTDSISAKKELDVDNYDNNKKKFAILTFDGGDKTQYINAKPILDKYGFKATFYVVCNYAQKASIENVSGRMNWNEIMDLYKQGHDVGAKSKNVFGFDEVSPTRSQYLISESKKCLQDQGINATSFVYPFNRGSDIKHITSTLSDHFELALTTKASTSAPLMFLDCRVEYVETIDDNNNQDRDANPDDSDSSSNDPGCREYLGNGSLSIINRYSIKAWSHDAERKENSLDDTQMLETFIEVANSQDEFNSEGNTAAAIPIIMWHKIEDTPDPYCTSLALFDLEMKYLHDNGFTVLTMADLKFDKNTNTLRVINNDDDNNNNV